ncbi:MAG TPA: acyl-CoA thioesterase [Candidatus Melainabacteria bacterium]|jgi:acyl-CoA thioester hydrolase|nr:acyl-CoA thioesterase [Candidatus Melainabacteria bacterium]HIN64478.1 acyl-CoA thioesterase [Candidatus Obscuribacterales bacterium]
MTANSPEKTIETSAQEKRLLEVDMEIFIGTYDIDFAAHVSNIVYLRWFEALRLKIFEKYYPLEQLMNDGFVPIITSHYIEYKRAIKLFDKPHGYMWIDSISKARLKFKGEIRVGGELATSAIHEGIFLTSSNMKPTKIPPAIIQLCNSTDALNK